MLHSLLILEHCWALVAREFCLVELLHGEPVDVFADIDLRPAIRASVLLLLPFDQALRTT